MKQKYFPVYLFFIIFFSCLTLQAQEIAKVRTTKYIFNLNTIKHQEQVDAVSLQTKKIKNVTKCKLDWLNYKMEVTVKEGGDFGSFPMEKLKTILIDNKVALKNFTKKTVPE